MKTKLFLFCLVTALFSLLSCSHDVSEPYFEVRVDSVVSKDTLKVRLCPGFQHGISGNLQDRHLQPVPEHRGFGGNLPLYGGRVDGQLFRGDRGESDGKRCAGHGGTLSAG